MLTDTIGVLSLITLSLGVLFVLNVLSCAYALGRFHTWLKGRAEVFGDNEGLRDELADIRGRLNEDNKVA